MTDPITGNRAPDRGHAGVRPSRPEDIASCQQVVHGLPDYFTEDVPARVAHDLVAHRGWVLTDDGAVLAFAVAEDRSPQVTEILWMAVRAEVRGRGLGSVLLDHVLRELRSVGVELVEVKTLDRSVAYQPYQATRAFWEQRGFLHLDTVDPPSGWPPENVAAVYVRVLR